MKRALVLGLVFTLGSAVGWLARDDSRPKSTRETPRGEVMVNYPDASTPSGRRTVHITLHRQDEAEEFAADQWLIIVNGVHHFGTVR